MRPRLPDYLTIDLSLYELRLLGIDTTGTASGSITITRDGKVYFGLAAAVTPGADQNPNVNVGIRAGWVGSPIGPRPTNDQIDGFVNGASVSVSGGTDINGGPFGITAGIVRNAPDSGIGSGEVGIGAVITGPGIGVSISSSRYVGRIPIQW